MFKYSIPPDFGPYNHDIIKLDSVLIPNIVKVAEEITTDQNDPIVFLTENPNDYTVQC